MAVTSRSSGSAQRMAATWCTASSPVLVPRDMSKSQGGWGRGGARDRLMQLKAVQDMGSGFTVDCALRAPMFMRHCLVIPTRGWRKLRCL